MTDEVNRIPKDELTPEEMPAPPAEQPEAAAPPVNARPPENLPPAKGEAEGEADAEGDADAAVMPDAGDDEESRMAERLERLGGEPAPAISPEEFARLQQSGQIHIDSRGRVRTSRREKTDAGMSLRKRRAWYA